MSQDLDDLDRKLVRLLRLDGRRPNSELSAEIGLSASACLRRIKQLEARGVIRGYTAIIDDDRDQGFVAIVTLTLEKQTEEHMRRFEAAIREHPEIEECFLMTGDADYLLRAATSNAAAYEQFHTHILARLPGVSRIHSSIALRNVLRSRSRSRPAT